MGFIYFETPCTIVSPQGNTTAFLD